MVFEQLLQSGVRYAYLMRMLKAVLNTQYSVLTTRSLDFIFVYAAGRMFLAFL